MPFVHSHAHADRSCRLWGSHAHVQVMPFVYTHLVATCCVSYLILNAIVKGMQFEPDTSLTFGFFLPLCSVLVIMTAILGLLEVGDTIMDPFGQDPEDFAVLHFVEWCEHAAACACMVAQCPPSP